MSHNFGCHNLPYHHVQEKSSEEDVRFRVDLESQRLIQESFVCDDEYDACAEVEETGKTMNIIE